MNLNNGFLSNFTCLLFKRSKAKDKYKAKQKIKFNFIC